MWVIVFIFVILPVPSWAIIPHDYPGAYPHQIGHIFAAIATSIFMYYIYKKGYMAQRAWRFIGLSAGFFVLWNVYTFLGHIVELYITQDVFIDKDSFWGGSMRLKVSTLCYYLYRLDNLILAPCLYFFYIGLKTLYTGNNR